MRWRISNPPTYQEFADMWTKEYQARKISPANPKQEWAYINFVQHYYLKKPNAPREKVLNAWENERIKHKNNVKIILEEAIKNSTSNS